MGVLNSLRGRNDAHIAAINHDTKDVVDDSEGSNADTLSLEARNEKDVQANPDTITSNAQEGIQKAEAAALVWSKPALYGAYAWYDIAALVTEASSQLIIF